MNPQNQSQADKPSTTETQIATDDNTHQLAQK